MPSRRHITPPATIVQPDNGSWREAYSLLTLLAVLFASHWFATQYFFAQDDFILLERGAFKPGAAISSHFNANPGQFRPLTKGAYFVAMYSTFGMNAFPYHIVALLLHGFNMVMTWRLLRRFGVASAGRLAGATLFAMSGGFFHVLAWISCVQQLLGLAMGLVCLEFGLRFIESGRSGDRWISLVAYLGAIGSMEQLAMLPAVLWLIAVTLPNERRTTPRLAASSYAWHLSLMCLYALFMVFWKGLPESGPYKVGFGSNIPLNFVTYLGHSFDYLLHIPAPSTAVSSPFNWTLALAVALLLYHLARKRVRAVVLGMGYFTAFILPALFLSNHVAHYHTYIPSLGTIYLVSLLADDLFPDWTKHPILQWGLYGVLAVFGIFAWRALHASETAYALDDVTLRNSFVIRRAIAAKTAYNSLSERRSDHPQSVCLIYARPPGRLENDPRSIVGSLRRTFYDNVVTALGSGSAIRLLYGSPDLPVTFCKVEEADTLDTRGADVFYFDDGGECRTPKEIGR